MNNVIRLADGKPASPAFLAGLANIDRAERRVYRSGNRVLVQPDSHPGTVIDADVGGCRYRVCLDGSGAIFWSHAVMLTPALQPVRLTDGGAS